jgi:hypothetical protein
MPELVEKARELVAFLKNGGRSGITGEFGKPMLFDSGSAADQAVSRAGDSPPEPRETLNPAESAEVAVGRGVHKTEFDSEARREAEAAILDPETSQQDKLKAANELARMGERSFTGPDGRRYDISIEEVGKRTLVSIHTNDTAGGSHAVLRGIVEADGNVSRQRDASGREVPYESNWASKNLPENPLVTAREKPEAAPPSPEREKLLATMKEKGIEPPSSSAPERTKLADEHGKLERDLVAAKARYDSVKREVDAKNKPLDAEIARIDTKVAELEEKQIPGAKIGEKNAEVARDLKEAGIGDGKTLTAAELDNPETFRKIREEIDSKVTDPAKREELKRQVNDLEQMEKDFNRVQAEIDKLYDKRSALEDRKWKNNEALSQPGKEYREIKKALYENEEKIRDTKFAEDLEKLDKLPGEKREAVYKSLEQIASDAGGPPNHLSPEQKRELIENLVHQIANPETISQGNKNTCGLASTEFELAKAYPEKYAKYVADLATAGEATTPDGRKLKIDPAMINEAGKDGALKPHNDGNPDRSMASMIFQTATANRILEDRAAAADPPKEPGKYISAKPGEAPPVPIEIRVGGDAKEPAGWRPSGDTGERIILPDGTVQDWDGVYTGELAKITTSLTGENYELTPVIGNRDLSKPEDMAAAQKDFLDVVDRNGVPIKVGVYVRNKDFLGMGSSEGGHEITITRVDKGPPAMVYYHNTAGGADHNYPTGQPVPLDEFMKAMVVNTDAGSGTTNQYEFKMITRKR